MEKTKNYLILQEQWKGQSTTWSSKSNEKDNILPGLARAMARTKNTWSSKSNGKDKVLPGLARTMERTNHYLV
jgi:hypothetical protein